jgi:LuxR family transcriptional regulator, maltose regulon positive regulatory protein
VRPEPSALPWVVDRPGLTALLEQRWTHRVVTLVAGAGFGKSTVLGMVIRPPGSREERTDHYVALDPSCGSRTELVRRLATAAGVTLDVDDPGALVDALDDRAGHHCLLLDDVHDIGDQGSVVEALTALVEALSPRVHVVLASRRPIPIPLARARAAGHVLDLTEADLAYSEAELDAVAALTGTAAAQLEGTGGWPALVSLTVRTGHQGALDFLAEEVLTELDAKTFDALAVAALAGTAEPEVLSHVAGFDGDPYEIASTVPLVSIDAAGAITPHALWAPAMTRQLAPDVRQRLLLELTDERRSQGDHRRALQMALQLADATTVAEVVRDLCATGHLDVDLEEIARWVRAAPRALSEHPEGRLLDAIARRATDPTGDETRARLEESVAELRAAGIVGCEVVALSELGLVLRWRGEADDLMPHVARLLELDAAGHRAASALAAFARGAIADQLGDSELTLASIEGLRRGDLPDAWMALVEFQRCHQLLLLGRPRDALDAARRSKDLGPPGYVGGWCAERSATWHLGVTRPLLDLLPMADEIDRPTAIDEIWVGAWFGAMQASAGRTDDAARNIAVATKALRSTTPPELVGFVEWARAALAVAHHEPERARALVAGFLAVYPVTAPLGRRFAARAPALVDLLLGDELGLDLAEVLDGPWQRQVLSVGRQLRALRAGAAPEPWPEPGLVLCALALPWAVELAVRGHLAGHDQARALAHHLLEVAGDTVTEEVEHHLDPDLRAAAQVLFAHEVRPGAPVVCLLGPVSVTGDPDLEGLEELRRRRVRELLAVVALEGPVSREALADALWPDLPPERAAANLRVNLTYLGRIRNAAGTRLVQDSPRGLILAEGVDIDVARVEHLAREASTARRAGYASTAVRLYHQAADLFRGKPLADTRNGTWFEHEAHRLEAGAVRAASTGAHLALEVGDPDLAVHLAETAVGMDRYDEPAWRVLLRARQRLGDHAGAAAAAGRLSAVLDELGTEPDDELRAALAAGRPATPTG